MTLHVINSSFFKKIVSNLLYDRLWMSLSKFIVRFICTKLSCTYTICTE